MSDNSPLGWLDTLAARGIKLGLETITALLARLDNPHTKAPTIIVGGTNGKGTTATLAASILTASGKRVGLSLSPHLADVRERIVVDGAMIDEPTFAALVDRVRAATVADPPLPVTYFEAIAAMAFLHFAEEKLDVAVVEVGLGGRFDAFNVVDPAVAIICSVGLDHVETLGGSLKNVALEKLGIVKEGRPLVHGVTRPRLQAHFETTCADLNAPCYRIGREFDVRYRKGGLTGERFDYRDPSLTLSNIKLPLVGRRQCDNGALAIRAARLFDPTIDEKTIRAGVLAAKIDGRFEIVRGEPLVILDGAHNALAVSELARTVGRLVDRPVALVFGAMKDKDYPKMVATLAPLCRSITFYAPSMDRASSSADLRAALPESFTGPIAEATSPEEVTRMVDDAPADTVWLVCGSFYLVGALRDQLRA